MATGPDLSSPAASAAAAAPASASAKKDRHIVSWSTEEDDVLRAQIALHGTDNWTIIAAQFKDKTARQCRRRWYNYLNSECKKGGWSQEEDMLLCEAQKVLGNKWTEIAKVVSGRTDNAVKNRFSTLCKKRPKDEEVSKEIMPLFSNVNAKRVLTQTGSLISRAPGSSPPIKQMRSCNSDFKENITPNMMLSGQDKSKRQDSRQPLAAISPYTQDNVNMIETHNHAAKTASKQLFVGEQNCVKCEGNFLNKDDPKIATLYQQADLLCSLATKINTENTSKSMDDAWQQLRHYLDKKDDNDVSESSMSGMASLLEDLDDLIVDPYENEEEDEHKSRQQTGDVDVQNKDIRPPTSMEVTSQMSPDKKLGDCLTDKSTENGSLCIDVLPSSMEPYPGADIPVSANLSEPAKDSRVQCMEYTSPVHTVIQPQEDAEIPASVNLSEATEHNRLQHMEFTSPARTVTQAKTDAETPALVNLCEVTEPSRHQCSDFTSPAHTAIQAKADVEISASENLNEVTKYSKLPCMEFTSPAHTVPTFQPYADDMPTPQITASERNFLLSVLELTSAGSRPDNSQQPSCKRALLNSL